MVGETNGEYSFSISQWEKAAQYIEAHPEVRDCLLSGGDPLSIGDDKLEWLLDRLRAIKHLEFIRIGTKIPVVMPQRITLKLTRMLKRFHPLWMSHPLHPSRRADARDRRGLRPPRRCRHPARQPDRAAQGHQRRRRGHEAADARPAEGAGEALLPLPVRPGLAAPAHFRTPVEKGLEIIKGLRGHTTGYAVPHFVIDAPGGGGKIPLVPDYVVGRDGDDLLLTNFEGGTYRYPDPLGNTGKAQNALRAEGFVANSERCLCQVTAKIVLAEPGLLKLVPIAGKGRGVVTTRPIQQRQAGRSLARHPHEKARPARPLARCSATTPSSGTTRPTCRPSRSALPACSITPTRPTARSRPTSRARCSASTRCANIEAGEELTWNYGIDPWFDVAE